MTKHILLIASLLLNALFTGWIVWQKNGGEEVAPPHSPSISPLPVEQLPESEPPIEAVPEPRPPTWSDVATDDLATYASNLSDLGAPRVLAKAILLGAVRDGIAVFLANADFGGPMLCKLPLHPDWNQNPGGPPAADAISTFHSGRRSLGISSRDFGPLSTLDVIESHTAFLPDEAQRIIDDYKQRIDGTRASDSGKASVEKLIGQREDELRRILSTDDFDEYQLRTSPYSRLPRTVRGIKLTADEMRAITQIYIVATRPDQTPSDAGRSLASLLGSERLAAWRKAVGMPGL